jgi:alpha-glucosidase (family GH31 glycosyl hydrolase)
MIGPFMMLAPILEKGAESRDVYFPQGTWYDLRTDAPVEGSQSLRVDASLDRMPIYLRGGSIIPAGNVVQSSDEDQGDLVLWIYPAGTSSIVVYEDDGISEKGPSAETRITQESTVDRVVITVDKRLGRWKPVMRSLIVELRGLARQPGSASIDGTRSPQAKSSQEFAKLRSGSYYDSTQHFFQTKLVDDGSIHKIIVAL